jgi:hypothetical protein
MAGSYMVTLKDRTITVTRQDLAMFRELYLGTSELTSRMSELLWLNMYTMDAAFGVCPHDIVRVIQELEGNAPASGIKPATKFRRMPLKGLWHKHFFSAHFVSNNILLGLGTNGLRKLVNEAIDPAKSAVITQEMIAELAWRIAEEPFKERENAKKTASGLSICRTTGKIIICAVVRMRPRTNRFTSESWSTACGTFPRCPRG